MDPNAALAAMREASAALAARSPENPMSLDDLIANLDTLIETSQALDGWLSAGGSLPTDWSTR